MLSEQWRLAAASAKDYSMLETKVVSLWNWTMINKIS